MNWGNNVSTVPRLKRLFTKRIDSDVLVVGGGSAGLLAAIAAAESGASVVLVDKGKVGRSGCSVFAAGILTFPLPGEDKDVWVDEMLRLGEFLNDQMWVKTLIDRCHQVVFAIDGWGTEYGKVVLERDADGIPVRRKSRAHINTAHCVFNAIPLMDTLRRRARQLGVQLVERTMVTDLLVESGRILGAVGFNYRSGERLLFGCRSAVASAGGGSFKSTFLGHRNLTGDLIAAAFRAGVVCRSFENLSTNTTARDFNTHGMNLYVGSGGRFVNGLGQEFMSRYDPTLGSRSTLPRLTQAFCHEAKEGRGPVFLDLSRVTPRDQDLLRRILPESFKIWDRAGIDPFRDKIPWIPAWQGTLTYGGGIHVNERCETSLEGLYAAGDATPVPPFGGGSIGGICLPYAITSGHIAGESAGRCVAEKRLDLPQPDALEELGREKMALALAPLNRPPGVTPDGVIRSMQEILMPWPVSYIRSAETLEAALSKLEGVSPAVGRVSATNLHDLVKANEVRNLALQGELILRSALMRTESRGTHYRIDFPYKDNENWLKWIFARPGNGTIELWTEDIPTPFLRPEEAREPHFLGV